jgi:hypothetical protein
MMGQEQKPLEEILDSLEGKEKIVIMGCGGCSTVFHTGGVEEVNEMEEILAREGKKVKKVPLPFAVFACYRPFSSMFVEKHKEDFEDCDAVLMMSCGDGLQTVREILDEMGIVKPFYPSINAMGVSGGGPDKFIEKCSACGECVVGRTAGICPLTECPKGLLNGPCGGTRPDGKCEVDPDKDCAWYLIYNRLKEIGEVEKISEFSDPHDWSKSVTPRTFEREPLDLHKHLARTKEVIESLGI